MKVTEGRVHQFVVSDLLQVCGETKLTTDIVCALKHVVKETDKKAITLKDSREITIKREIQGAVGTQKKSAWQIREGFFEEIIPKLSS